MERDPRLEDEFWENLSYDSATIEAVGKVTDALDTVEVARGHLYAFHRMTGTAGREMSEAADLLEKAGHAAEAQRLRDLFVGRDVIAGRWTFQVVEEYDGLFYGPFRQFEADVRDLVGGHRHLHEAALKRSATGQAAS